MAGEGRKKEEERKKKEKEEKGKKGWERKKGRWSGPFASSADSPESSFSSFSLPLSLEVTSWLIHYPTQSSFPHLFSKKKKKKKKKKESEIEGCWVVKV